MYKYDRIEVFLLKKICSQCSKEFELSEGEISFYKNKGLSLPNRCKSCREQNKQNKSDMQYKMNSAPQRQAGADKSAFWQKKPLWFSVLALVLIVAAALYFGGNNGGDAVSELSTPTSSAVSDVSPDAVSEASQPDTPVSSAENTEPTSSEIEPDSEPAAEYTFRNETYLTQHFQKHGDEFDYETAEEYLAGANRVINDPNALTKTEKEDGDLVFYLESTNEFVILSTDGYIRTYFRPSDGLDYFNRQ